MSSRLRRFGLRIAFLFVLVAAAATIRVTAGKPMLPFALLESFDRAYGLVEQRVDALEQAAARPPATSLATWLDRLAAEVDRACDAAAARLDTELVLAPALPDARRATVRGCIEHHLAVTRYERARATDPDLRAEYDATLDRLREIRERV